MRRHVLSFRLRDRDGRVEAEYGPNEDPERWDYGLLGLGYPSEEKRGLPVRWALVDYAGEGGAAMAWIQVIRYGADSENETVLVDTASQPAGTGVPYYSWGPNPSFFDAPSMPRRRRVTWMAGTFLVASPDALMTRTVKPLRGFGWGYTTRGGRPELLPIKHADRQTWSSARRVPAERYPAWGSLPG